MYRGDYSGKFEMLGGLGGPFSLQIRLIATKAALQPCRWYRRGSDMQELNNRSILKSTISAYQDGKNGLDVCRCLLGVENLTIYGICWGTISASRSLNLAFRLVKQ